MHAGHRHGPCLPEVVRWPPTEQRPGPSSYQPPQKQVAGTTAPAKHRVQMTENHATPPLRHPSAPLIPRWCLLAPMWPWESPNPSHVGPWETNLGVMCTHTAFITIHNTTGQLGPPLAAALPGKAGAGTKGGWNHPKTQKSQHKRKSHSSNNITMSKSAVKTSWACAEPHTPGAASTPGSDPHPG